jgi:hypothetical protein
LANAPSPNSQKISKEAMGTFLMEGKNLEGERVILKRRRLIQCGLPSLFNFLKKIAFICFDK